MVGGAAEDVLLALGVVGGIQLVPRQEEGPGELGELGVGGHARARAGQPE